MLWFDYESMIAPAHPWNPGLETRVRDMFGPQGLLSRAKNYEFRPGQQKMAEAVARALSETRHLVVEAGTGIGKSLAYLVPALHFAVENQRKALICTHTINLQEQLFNKDIPLLDKLVDFEFRAALLKGRQNYICPLRLERALAQADGLFASSEQAELKRLQEWLHTTRDGTLSDFNETPDQKVWSQVCSEPHICTYKSCGNNPKCFYQQARKRLLEAHLVVLNHSLFFTHLGGLDEETTAEGSYLFPGDFVIFDEAHTLETAAARCIGLSASAGSITHLLQRLYHPRTHKGLLTVARHVEGQKLAVDMLDLCDTFFAQIENACDFRKGNTWRVRQPELVEDTLSLPAMQLRQMLLDAAQNQSDETMQSELQEMARRLGEFRQNLKSFLQQEEKDYVYWVERSPRSQGYNYELQGAPVDISEILGHFLFRPDNTAILTSATLSADSSLNYFINRVGAHTADTLQIESPFDYARQMKVFIPRNMPEPAKNPSQQSEYENALARWIRYFVAQTRGRAFVLFTSYGSMQRMAQMLSGWMQQHGYSLLVQGGGMSRAKMLEDFKKSPQAVLFGTDSFWQGVDVPGDALVNVIITRLPFAVPDHPLIEARIEWIEQNGGNAFREFSLPEAILKFRQGVGRLIRTASDQGIIAVLDGRVLSKNYGKNFLAKLPKCPVEILDDSVLPP